MTAIPKSNKPEEPKAGAAVADPEFEKKISEYIRLTKEELGVADKKDDEANASKVAATWNTGKRIAEISANLSKADKHKVIERFAAEAGKSVSFYHVALQFVEMFSEEQYKSAIKAGLNVRTVKALVAISDVKKRNLMIEKAVNEGLSEDDIRVITGKKGARKAAFAKRSIDKASKKPPSKVFSTTQDRLSKVPELVTISTDAVSRLGSCKTEDDRLDAVTKLIELRDEVEKAKNSLEEFLKHTKPFVKTAAQSPRPAK